MISSLTNPFYAYVKASREFTTADTLFLDIENSFGVAKPILRLLYTFGSPRIQVKRAGLVIEMERCRISVRASIGAYFNPVCIYLSDSIYTRVCKIYHATSIVCSETIYIATFVNIPPSLHAPTELLPRSSCSQYIFISIFSVALDGPVKSENIKLSKYRSCVV